ncbi:restriction endonuclease subunit S [Brevibacterium casei]|uniref:restriction endonuclease subunit S n=1 Tax=Brevibacterium casei TaxID=33889 RepID=UPI0035E447D0
MIHLQRGHDLPVSARAPGNYPVVGSNGILSLHNEARYAAPGVTIGRSGVIGGAVFINEPYWPLNTTLFVKDFRGNDPRWIYYLLKSIDFSGFNSGSAQPSLNRNYIAGIELAVPTLVEQRAIAATLGALDDKIESNRRTISLIDELVRTRFEADFNLAQPADGVSVADLIPINRKQRLSRGTKTTYVGMPSLPEFSPEIFDWGTREFGSGQKFVNGDVLMARITPCLENGKTAIVDMLEDGEVGWGSTEFVVLSPKGLITTPWIYALVRHESVREWAIRRMAGTSGRQRFRAEDFGDYRIAEPDHKNLEEFNSFAEPLFARMTQLRNEVKRLTSLREALLPELLSGRICSPIEEEVA